MDTMKAAILIESLTGNTWKAGELIAANLQQEGWSITGFSAVKTPDHASIQEADTVIVGTWVHGLFVVGQAPWAIDRLRALPAMSGKKAVAFCTFALNPGKSLDVMTNTLLSRGADVVGGLALHRGKLAEHSEEFAIRLVDSVSAK
jgi:flavodoxin